MHKDTQEKVVEERLIVVNENTHVYKVTVHSKTIVSTSLLLPMSNKAMTARKKGIEAVNSVLMKNVLWNGNDLSDVVTYREEDIRKECSALHLASSAACAADKNTSQRIEEEWQQLS